jgi:hypothetical protein
MIPPILEATMPYSVNRVAHSAQLAALGWDDMLGTGDFHLSTIWLGVLEEMLSVKPVYLVATDQRGALAGLVVHRLDATAPPWDFYRLDRVLSRLLTRAQPFGLELPDRIEPPIHETGSVLPTLLCGGRHTSYSRLLVNPQLGPTDAMDVTKSVLDAVDELAAQLDARTAGFMFVDEPDVRLTTALTDHGYHRFVHGQSSVLDVVGTTLDDYLAQRSKKRRWSIRKEIRQLAEAGVSYRVRPLDEDTIAQITPLEIALEARYGVDDDIESAARNHRVVSRHLGDQIRTMAAEADGRVRGFLNFVHWRDDITIRQAGFDYAFQGSLPLYFGVLFYAMVPFAMEVGARHIHYSVESETAKRSRGCRTVQQLGFAKGFGAPWSAQIADTTARLQEEPAASDIDARQPAASAQSH